MTRYSDRSPAGASRKGDVFGRLASLVQRTFESARRAFTEFLTIPAIIVGGFLLLAALTYWLDGARAGTGEVAGLFGTQLFSDPDTARTLLETIATGIITVTSITFSLLLIAVQQSAAALSSQVFDQFLLRRTNQFYFGFFLGLSLYALVILASVTPAHNPVIGVTLAFLMTIAALCMLVLLIYQTIDQMRPVVVIGAIRRHALEARERQLDLIASTRRAPLGARPVAALVTAADSGFLCGIDVDALSAVASESGGDTEIVIAISIGDYVSFGDTLAVIRSEGPVQAGDFDERVRGAVHLEHQRDVTTDPAFGIVQLTTIGWTSISTAMSNPNPGLLACNSLRDLLARWIASDGEALAEERPEERAPVVYKDNVIEQLIGGFESLVVSASESMQHQSAAEIYRALALLFPRLPRSLEDSVEALLLRSLPALGDHVMTGDLDAALSAIGDALAESGRAEAAATVRLAQQRLSGTIGQFGSRATRAS